MPQIELTAEQQAESDRLFAELQAKVQANLRALADLLASKPTEQLLGATEFQVRDQAHQIAAQALQSALDGRKTGGTWGAVALAPTVPPMPLFTAGNRARS